MWQLWSWYQVDWIWIVTLLALTKSNTSWVCYLCGIPKFSMSLSFDIDTSNSYGSLSDQISFSSDILVDIGEPIGLHRQNRHTLVVINIQMYTHNSSVDRTTLKHCVPRAQVCEVWPRPYLFAYCLNIYHTMHFIRFRPCCNAVFKLSGRNWVKCIVL